MDNRARFGEHHTRKGFLVSKLKRDRCVLLRFKSREGYFEYKA